LTVVTNSALVCLELSSSSENLIVGIGGQFDPVTACYIGPTSEDAAAKFYVDLAFFSAKGFLPVEGTFESAVTNIRVKQLVAGQASQVVMLVDHSKFGQRALCKAIDISHVYTVITDEKAPTRDIEMLERMGKKVIVAYP
jgi:DeoR/GlpR family transcriptional regulator of sugar metabolism